MSQHQNPFVVTELFELHLTINNGNRNIYRLFCNYFSKDSWSPSAGQTPSVALSFFFLFAFIFIESDLKKRNYRFSKMTLIMTHALNEKSL